MSEHTSLWSLRIPAALGAQVATWDSLNQPDAFVLSTARAARGSRTLSVAALGQINTTDRFWVWDATSFEYEEVAVESINGLDLTLRAPLESTYAVGAIVSCTSPLDDLSSVRLAGSVANGDESVRYIGFSNADPSAFTEASLATVSPGPVLTVSCALVLGSADSGALPIPASLAARYVFVMCQDGGAVHDDYFTLELLRGDGYVNANSLPSGESRCYNLTSSMV